MHPDDQKELQLKASKTFTVPFTSYKSFLDSNRFGATKDPQFHLSLLPNPYTGKLDQADIFLLMLNPGLNVVDYYAEFRVEQFRNRKRDTLHQEFQNTDFPFLYLDPEFCWHTGFQYWDRKLRPITLALAEAKYGGRYLRALRELSARVAILQMVPYHSSSFAGHALKLRSVEQAKRFACDWLYPRAAEGKRLVIVLRGRKEWDARSGCPNIVCYEAGQARGASLGRGTPGGEAILRFLGLQTVKTQTRS